MEYCAKIYSRSYIHAIALFPIHQKRNVKIPNCTNSRMNKTSIQTFKEHRGSSM
jgi:hypothetical protein